MNKIFRNFSLMLAVGAFAASCADYNETNNFTAAPDPSYVEPYKDLGSVKSYVDRNTYPNMSLGATISIEDFNRQELAHSAAVTNFDNISFGTAMMSGAIINNKGVMNFLKMTDLLNHMQEIGGVVYGSPIAANSGQADKWLSLLTSPIEIIVEPVVGEPINFNSMSVGPYDPSLIEKGSASIVKYDNQNTLKINSSAKVRILSGFEADSKAKYTFTFWVKADKTATFSVIFSGATIEGPSGGRFTVAKADGWKKIVIEAVQPAEGVTDGYVRIENTLATPVYVNKVEWSFVPDNHRDQTAKEINDTIHYAMGAWCDGLMKTNAGRIKSFDLIEDAIGGTDIEPGIFDLRHSKDKIFWQDYLGSDQYAPKVSKNASEAFVKHGGNASELKFFISESGLDNEKKFNSLKYWMNIWESNGAKIDGINAKVNLIYSEDATKQAANEASLNTLLDNLAATGKLIRISNFDIKYQDASGANVTTKEITDTQRQTLANYYAQVIKTYLAKIPKNQQAGLCKGSIVDTGDPVGLWSVVNKDWVRNATYKAFCDAVSGKTN